MWAFFSDMAPLILDLIAEGILRLLWVWLFDYVQVHGSILRGRNLSRPAGCPS